MAAFLGVSPETVLRRWRAGELLGYRLASNVLRFRESEIETWLEGTRPERSRVSVREKVRVRSLTVPTVAVTPSRAQREPLR